ncbi:alpha/beta hydrolase [Lichenihabitans sp. PAMC28606]|uniref:alpha/beta fold hydrolase n=1 Tax=Lichenihabitans sp. PAMC28606 TaxID=2880932 RepID=UPI001D0A7173|nr:alpha/beta hydrolase [Lichenihabitans sp. PAMC28606]UDL93188.1 alpha/beta hydrolase [Lichenihabitans sp. PAMC28606]
MRSLVRGAAWAAGLVLASSAGLFGFSMIEASRIAAQYPATGSFMPVSGGRLHYTERRPDGPSRGTVILLHGATGNQADVMLPLGDRLAALGFRVIAPDRPGHGWSDRPDGESDASPARQATLIRQGLESLGIHHAIVLGHSWSGALAVNFALDQADFTDGLVLVAPVTHPWPGGVAWYYGPAASPSIGPIFNHVLTMPVGLTMLDAGVRSVFEPQAPPPDFANRTGVYLVLRPSEFTANAQDVFHLEDFVEQQAPRMGRITAPTAIVTGDSDSVVLTRLHSYGSERDIPGATLKVLAGVGHSPHWADPASVVAAIVSVADRADAKRRTVQE